PSAKPWRTESQKCGRGWGSYQVRLLSRAWTRRAAACCRRPESDGFVDVDHLAARVAQLARHTICDDRRYVGGIKRFFGRELLGRHESAKHGGFSGAGGDGVDADADRFAL